jgi:predicted transcriptional regulator
MDGITVTPAGDEIRSLRARRLAIGLSQEKLARAAHCSTAMVKLLERGFTPTRSEVLPRIVQALNDVEPAGNRLDEKRVTARNVES